MRAALQMLENYGFVERVGDPPALSLGAWLDQDVDALAQLAERRQKDAERKRIKRSEIKCLSVSADASADVPRNVRTQRQRQNKKTTTTPPAAAVFLAAPPSLPPEIINEIKLLPPAHQADAMLACQQEPAGQESKLAALQQFSQALAALGTKLDTEMNALQAGSNRSLAKTDGDSSYASQQVHWYKFPVWSLLDLFVDFPCNDGSGFDLAYPSEIDPTWQDDLLSFILNPEALLFGNPITQLSCMADTVASTVGAPLDPLFWCQGAWGSAYPLNGSSSVTNPNHLNASMVGRMTYKLGREALLWDTAIDKTGCSVMGEISPIWNKSNYRIQVAKPRKRNDCLPIGRPDFLWGSAVNPPLGTGSQAPDNYMWVMTRARICCVGYSF